MSGAVEYEVPDRESLRELPESVLLFVFPEGTTIESGGYKSIYTADTPDGFGLGGNDSVRLFDADGEIVEEAVVGWVETVCVDHPAFARTMRGSNPPAFLEERARIDRIVQKVAAKRSRRGA